VGSSPTARTILHVKYRRAKAKEKLPRQERLRKTSLGDERRSPLGGARCLIGRKHELAAPEKRSTISSTKDIDFVENNRQTLNGPYLHLAWIFSRIRSRGRASRSREALF
jgi:hypothetical protein